MNLGFKGFNDEWMRNYKRKIAGKNCSALPTANVEQVVSLRPLAEKKNKRLDTQGSVRLHIKSFRHRLCDADGVSAKYAIDGLVHAGLLANDSPDSVKEVSYEQIKIGKEKIEHTIIEVWL